MSDESRVEVSPTSVSREVFGHLWGLVFLGALRREASVPFGPVLAAYVAEHGDGLARVRSFVQRALGLPDDVMPLFDDVLAKWPEDLDDAEAVAGWLSLYSRHRAAEPPDLGDLPAVQRLVQYAIRSQLYGLVEALVLGVASRPRVADERLSDLHRALIEAAQLAGERDPEAAARQSYEAWAVAGLADYLSSNSQATDQARSELRAIAARLEPIFDPS